MAGDRLIVSRDIGKDQELDAIAKAAERREAAANQPKKASPVASGGKPATNPAFISNKTIGRIKSMQCSRDDIDPADPKAGVKNRLQEQQQRYTDHATGKAPLSPQESLALRSDIDRLSKLADPNAQNLWPDYSTAEKDYLAQQTEEKRRFANNLGMMAGGPVFAILPMAGRMLGAPESVIENLATINVDLAGIGILGAKGRMTGEVANSPRPAAPMARTGARATVAMKSSPGNGLYVAKRNTLDSKQHGSWLEKQGYKNVSDHVKSADLKKPVELTEIKKGDELWMYVRDGGKPGSYATIPGITPDELAIDGAGRHLERFVVTSPMEVIQSVAGEFPKGVYPGVGGAGGGVQLQLPANYSDFLKKIN